MYEEGVELWLHVLKVTEISFNSFNVQSTRGPTQSHNMSVHKQPFVPGLDGNSHEIWKASNHSQLASNKTLNLQSV